MHSLPKTRNMPIAFFWGGSMFTGNYLIALDQLNTVNRGSSSNAIGVSLNHGTFSGGFPSQLF